MSASFANDNQRARTFRDPGSLPLLSSGSSLDGLRLRANLSTGLEVGLNESKA